MIFLHSDVSSVNENDQAGQPEDRLTVSNAFNHGWSQKLKPESLAKQE